MKLIPVGNTYGKNAFREVRFKCTRCLGTQKWMAQCDTGRRDQNCDLCRDMTPHVITEVSPKKP